MKTKLFLFALIAATTPLSNAQTGGTSGGSSGTTGGSASTGSGTTSGTANQTTGSGSATGSGTANSGAVNSGTGVNSQTTGGAGVGIGVNPSAGVGTTTTAPRVRVVDSSGQVSPVAPPVGPFGPVGNQNRPQGTVPGGQFGAAGNPAFNTNMNRSANGFGPFGPLTNSFGAISNQFGIGSNVTGIGINTLPTNGLWPTGRTNGMNRILQSNQPGMNLPGTVPGGGMTQPLPGSNP